MPAINTLQTLTGAITRKLVSLICVSFATVLGDPKVKPRSRPEGDRLCCGIQPKPERPSPNGNRLTFALSINIGGSAACYLLLGPDPEGFDDQLPCCGLS